MPVTIPTHKATQQSDCGILLKTISPGSFQEPVQYAHRDDYYIFGIVENGHCCISIDFKITQYRTMKYYVFNRVKFTGLSTQEMRKQRYFS